ncbi:MAG: T9SS type A sorting domain-containing protein [Bacteroidetes bacterium]|nr:T9SS type A sorting domain-containing protein [Bacteroidota bacterium]
MIDVDNFIDYISAEVLTANKSWWHNRRVWRPKVPGGKFKWLLFDLDYGYSIVDADILKSIGDNDPVFSRLITNESFRQRFIQRLAALDQTTFEENRMIHFIDSLADRIDHQINRHLEKWGGTYPGMVVDKADWAQKVEIGRYYAKNRPQYTEQYLNNYFGLSGKISTVFSVEPAEAGELLVNGKYVTGDQFNGEMYNSVAFELEALSHPGYSFESWSSGVATSSLILIPKESDWKYHELGVDLGTIWREVSFDDTDWKNGLGPLGYDNVVETEIGFGNDPDNKPSTVYFRKTINVDNPDQFDLIRIGLLRDDGAVVYVNGTEVARSNMPSGNIVYSSLATEMTPWLDESVYFEYNFSSDYMLPGDNIIAVEIHQDRVNSPDLSFDLELIGLGQGGSSTNKLVIESSVDLNITAYFSKSSQGPILISEILYAPADDIGGNQAQFVELVNFSKKTVDVSGFTFTEGINFVFPSGTVLIPNERVIICKNSSVFQAIPGKIYQWTSGDLAYDGESIVLRALSGEIADQLTYGTSAPWPLNNLLNGSSIELIHGSKDNSLAENWAASLATGGSPLLENSRYYEGIHLNELLANPVDQGYLKNLDWFEISNTGDHSVDIAGLYFSDRYDEPMKWQIDYSAPELTILEPGEFILIVADSDPEKGALHADFKLSGKSGDLTMSLATTGFITILDYIQYEIQGDGESFGRFPDGSGEWQRYDEPSPGDINLPNSKFIIAPYQIESGDQVPIYIKVLNEDGSVDQSFEGAKSLLASNVSFSPSTILCRKGVGYVLTTIEASDDFEFTIEDLDDLCFVQVKDQIPAITLLEDYNSDLTLLSGIDYLINTDLNIGQFGSLTIERGARIKLGNEVNIISNGPVEIRGSSIRPVVFMPQNEDEPWGGLWIKEQDSESELNYAFFVSGGNDFDHQFYHTETQAVIRADQADLKLSNCYVFDNIGKAFGSEFAQIKIDNCLFATSAMGPEFRNSYSEVSNSWIMDMPDPDRILDSDDADGIYFWKEYNNSVGPSIFENCVVVNVEDDAIDMLETDVIIRNCGFYDIIDKASSIGYRSIAYYDRCLVIDCNIGISSGWWSSVIVNHTTFHKTGRPLYNQRFGGVDVYNSILTNYHDQEMHDEYSLGPAFFFCLSDEQVLPGENNLQGEAEYLNSHDDNFRLLNGSPAIDSGDPLSELDPDGTRTDMGRYPYNNGTAGDVIINEIYYNAPDNQGPDDEWEFIEIFNPTSNKINVSGYKISKAVDFVFPFDTWVDAGEYLMVVADKNAYSDLECQVFEYDDGKLSNTGEVIQFISSTGDIINQIEYSDKQPWSPLADGNGFSLELSDPQENNSQAINWRSSYEVWGTPGRLNRVPDFSKISFNEIMLKNEDFFRNDADEFSSWIEIFNGSDYAVNAGGWIIKDSKILQQDQISISDPSATLIKPGGFLLLNLDGKPDLGFSHLQLNPENTGGELELYYLESDATTMQLVSKIVYDLIPENQSYACYPDGGTKWMIYDTPTPKSSNFRSSEYLRAPRIFTKNEIFPVITVLGGEKYPYPEMINQNIALDLEQDSKQTQNIVFNKGLGISWIDPGYEQSGVLKIEEDSLHVQYDEYRPIRTRNEKLGRSETWTKEHDYHITYTILIPSTATLTIKAGTRILVSKYANFVVEGNIIIEGTQEDPVIIMPLESGENWGGIQINNLNSYSSISHCFITGGGGGSPSNIGRFQDQAIVSSYADLVLDNVYLIENEGKAVYMNNSHLEMQDCVISGLASGVELEKSSSLINHCYFVDIPGTNAGVGAGDPMAILSYGEKEGTTDEILIENSYFDDLDASGIQIENQIDAIIKHSFFEGVADVAIASLSGNLYVENSAIGTSGVGIYVYGNSKAVVDHLTFHNNNEAIRIINGNIGGNNPGVQIHNSVLSESDSDIYSEGSVSLELDFTLSTELVHVGTGNILGDPVFNDQGISDYTLLPGSPCINSGDPSSAIDDDGTITEMGAYQYLGGGQSFSSLIINEIHYSPKDAQSSEFIELYNPNSFQVELAGYKITGDVNYDFPQSQVLMPYQYLVICESKEIYAARGIQCFEWDNGSLPSSSGIVRLLSADDSEIDFVIYNNSEDWTEWPNGKGPSLELKDPFMDNSFVQNWRTSYFIGGTPGEPNETAPLEELFLNEFVARSYAFYPDENGNVSDWIELYNGSSHMLNLKDVSITRDLGTPDMHILSAADDDLLFIEPNGFMVLRADDDSDAGEYHLSFMLSGSSGEIGLYLMQNGTYSLIDEISYTEQQTDVSYGRASDGYPVWQSFASPTPGASNSDNSSAISGLYINEFMARNTSVHLNNVNQYDDWIEIYNSNDEAVDIGGLFITDRSSDLEFWQIPVSSPEITTLSAKGYLMLYPSGDPDLGVQHTNFQLAGGGEYIALSQRYLGQLSVVDDIMYPAQTNNISYGRTTDAGLPWVFFNEPTPLRSNQASSGLEKSEILNNQVRIYPNPVSQDLYIQVILENASVFNMQIMNAMGETVLVLDDGSQNYPNGNFEFVVNLKSEGFKTGIYLIRILINNQVLTKRFIMMD